MEDTVTATTTRIDTITTGMAIPYSRGGKKRWVKCETSTNGVTATHRIQ